MKKFLIILFVVLFIVSIGAAVFLATLDVDKFRPQIVSQIENALQKSVKLEKIKLGWKSGIALDLQGFALLKSKQSGERLVGVQSAKAVLKLAPLLSRRIEVAAVYLNQPVVRLVKNPDGTFEGWEPEPAQPGQAPGEATPPAPGTASPLSLLVNEIRIQNGELFYKDAFGKEPMEVTLRKVTVEVDGVALDQPIDFSVRAAVCSTVQNLDFKGKLNVSSKDFIAVLNGFHAELELMPLELKELVKVSPAIATSGLVFPVEGTLKIDADSLKLDEKGLQEAAAKVRLEHGKIRLKALKSPIEDISADALVSAAMIKIQKLTANLAGGTVEGQGAVNMTDPLKPAAAFDVKAGKLLIEELAPAPKKAAPQMKGSLSLAVRGNLTGQTSGEITKALSAEGTATVEQGVITDMNILREVFQKISVIPGLVQRLLARLPEDYKKKLSEKDTKLDTIQIPFSVRNGTVTLPQINVATDSFQLRGSGAYGLDQGAVGGVALLAIDKELSAAMIRSVEELQFLANTKGELQIPLSIQGNVPQVTVMPDLQAVASKIATQKATDMLSGYLEKALGKKEASKDATAAPTSSEPAKKTALSAKGILGELLRQTVSGAGTTE